MSDIESDSAEKKSLHKKLSKESFREAFTIFNCYGPYRDRLIAGLCFLTIGSLMSLSFPLLSGGLIDAALKSEGAILPIIGPLKLNQIVLLLAATIVGQIINTGVSSYILDEAGQKALTSLRHRTYARLISLPMTFLSHSRSAELSSRIFSDIAQLENTVTNIVPQLFKQSIFLLGGIVLIAFTSGKLTLLMLGILLPVGGIGILLGRKIQAQSCAKQDRLADAMAIVHEALQTMTSVKSFTNELYEVNRFHSANHALSKIVTHINRWRSLFVAFINLAFFGGIAAVMWVGVLLLKNGSISVGELTRFVLYTTFIAGATGQFSDLLSQVQRALGSTQRIREIQREPIEAENCQLMTDARLPVLLGHIELNSVSFRYASRPEIPVLIDISLSIKAGEKIALVGPSGAGKSTITALLLRFYEPDKGRILFDGVDAHDYPLAWLRGQVALVPQETILLGGSIAENIAYGRPGASELEITNAAKLGNADEFIRKFPQGYDTIVGDRGLRLSGGQRQRIAIARAILKNPRVLILDEATSSLDGESEKLVQDALTRLMQDRTTFIVAHRLATIRSADRIALVDAGQIIEVDTHEELIIRSARYRRLCASQYLS